jgi:uncharacterized protein YeaO (DUF488 family)
MVKVRRVYDPDEAGEKYKVFVDRLCPRGISKEKEHGTITLLYSSKEEKYNNTVALREFLAE